MSSVKRAREGSLICALQQTEWAETLQIRKEIICQQKNKDQVCLIADMSGLTEWVFLVLSAAQFILGMLGNGFIGLVNGSSWFNKRISVSDSVITKLALSRTVLLCILLVDGVLFQSTWWRDSNANYWCLLDTYKLSLTFGLPPVSVSSTAWKLPVSPTQHSSGSSGEFPVWSYGCFGVHCYDLVAVPCL